MILKLIVTTPAFQPTGTAPLADHQTVYIGEVKDDVVRAGTMIGAARILSPGTIVPTGWAGCIYDSRPFVQPGYGNIEKQSK